MYSPNNRNNQQMRIELSTADYEILLKILIVNKRNIALGQRLQQSIVSDKLQQYQQSKKQENYDKVCEAVQRLQMEGLRVTLSEVARVTGLSRVTVSKYRFVLDYDYRQDQTEFVL